MATLKCRASLLIRPRLRPSSEVGHCLPHTALTTQTGWSAEGPGSRFLPVTVQTPRVCVPPSLLAMLASLCWPQAFALALQVLYSPITHQSLCSPAPSFSPAGLPLVRALSRQLPQNCLSPRTAADALARDPAKVSGPFMAEEDEAARPGAPGCGQDTSDPRPHREASPEATRD